MGRDLTESKYDISRLKRELHTPLRAWFRRHARAMPWRETKDPYAIWVSETMLQQTQVATVIPYYTRFLERFPTVEALAGAEQQEVLRMWAGLGYYRRAKHLHAGAQAVVRDFAGKVPQSAAQLVELPGVGRYTAGAIASIAFDEAAAVLDGNVARVLTRLGGIRDDVADAKVLKKLWFMADSLVPKTGAGDYNQAMMELGATVCRPVGPDCKVCPLKELCVARAEGSQGEIPVKAKKGATPVVRRVAVVLLRACPPEAALKHPNGGPKRALNHPKREQLAPTGLQSDTMRGQNSAPLELGVGGGWEVLLMQRPGGVIWENLWEFPAVDGEVVSGQWSGGVKTDRKVGGGGGKGEKSEELEFNWVEEMADVVGKRLGVIVTLARWHGALRHQLTHRTMEYRIVRGRVGGGDLELPACDGGRYQAMRWVSWTEAPNRELPLARVTEKVWEMARREGGSKKQVARRRE